MQYNGFEVTCPVRLHYWLILRNPLGKRGLFTIVNIARPTWQYNMATTENLWHKQKYMLSFTEGNISYRFKEME